MPEEKQQQAMALVIMSTVGLEKEKYRLGHTKVMMMVVVLTMTKKMVMMMVMLMMTRRRMIMMIRMMKMIL